MKKRIFPVLLAVIMVINLFSSYSSSALALTVPIEPDMLNQLKNQNSDEGDLKENDSKDVSLSNFDKSNGFDENSSELKDSDQQDITEQDNYSGQKEHFNQIESTEQEQNEILDQTDDTDQINNPKSDVDSDEISTTIEAKELTAAIQALTPIKSEDIQVIIDTSSGDYDKMICKIDDFIFYYNLTDEYILSYSVADNGDLEVSMKYIINSDSFFTFNGSLESIPGFEAYIPDIQSENYYDSIRDYFLANPPEPTDTFPIELEKDPARDREVITDRLNQINIKEFPQEFHSKLIGQHFENLLTANLYESLEYELADANNLQLTAGTTLVSMAVAAAKSPKNLISIGIKIVPIAIRGRNKLVAQEEENLTSYAVYQRRIKEANINGERFHYSRYTRKIIAEWTNVEGTWYFNVKEPSISDDFEYDMSIMKRGIELFRGWHFYNGNYYYYDNFLMLPGKPVVGLYPVDIHYYYFNEDGIMQTGMQNINDKTYYFNEAGIMQTGWQIIANKTYYFSKNGVMYTGNHTIDGIYYEFDSNGVLIIKDEVGVDFSLDKPFNGIVNFDGDNDVITMDIKYTTGYRVELSSDTNPLQISIAKTDSPHNSVFYSDGKSISRVVYLTPGTYYIRITHANSFDNPIPYTLKVSSAPPDTPGSTVNGAQAILFDNDIEYKSRIDYSEDVDVFKICIPYRAGLKFKYNSDKQLDIQIRDALGGHIYRSVNYNSEHTLLFEPGTYYIETTHANNFYDTPFEYAFSFHYVYLDQPGDTKSEAMPILLDKEYREGMDFSGDVDIFKIDIDYRTGYILEYSSLSRLDVAVYDKFGNTYYHKDNLSDKYVLGLEPGTYYIEITHYSRFSSAFDYYLTINSAPQDKAGDSSSDAVDIFVDVENKERIDYNGDIDTFKIKIDYRTGYVLNYSASKRLDVLVHDKYGNTLYHKDNFSDEFVLGLEPGIYYISVTHYSVFNNTPFDYSLTVQSTPEDNAGDTSSNAADISVDVDYQERIDYNGDIDTFKVKINYRTGYILNYSSSKRLDVLVYDRYGNTLYHKDNYSDEFVLGLEPGIYYISITHYSAFNNAPFDYNLTVQSTPEDKAGDSSSDAAVIAIDVDYQERIDYNGDIDTFKVEVDYRTGYILNYSSSKRLDVLVYDKNGNTIYHKDNYSDEYVLGLEPGIYYISVTHYSAFNNDPFVYNLALKSAPRDIPGSTHFEAQTISVGRTHTSRIDYQYDIDVFEFKVTNQASYYLDFGAEKTIDIRVFQSFGNTVFSNSSSSGRYKMDLEPGTYYIGVTHYSSFSNSPFNYSFSIN